MCYPQNFEPFFSSPVKEKYLKTFSEYSKIVLHFFTFIIDITINIMSEPFHKYEKSKHYLPSFESI